MNRMQFRNWRLQAVLAALAALVVIMACNLPWQNQLQSTQSIDNGVFATEETVVVDMTLSWSNSPNIDLVEGGNTPGVLWRVTNKTDVEFIKGELMYLSGGVLEVFEPTRMEFTTRNMFADQDIVNSMFIKLTSADGNNSTCVIHSIDGNTASMSCTGFSAQ